MTQPCVAEYQQGVGTISADVRTYRSVSVEGHEVSMIPSMVVQIRSLQQDIARANSAMTAPDTHCIHYFVFEWGLLHILHG